MSDSVLNDQEDFMILPVNNLDQESEFIQVHVDSMTNKDSMIVDIVNSQILSQKGGVLGS